MGVKEEQLQSNKDGNNDESACSSTKDQKSDSCPTSCHGSDEGGCALCRVCHCEESDRRGEVALDFLDISPPSQGVPKVNRNNDSTGKSSSKVAEKDLHDINCGRKSGFVEFMSPEGEIFICSTDIEEGCSQQDAVIDLGCSCKNDLALAHYACALKWFISHGSTTCEICGSVAKNVRHADFKKVLTSLHDYECLRERTETGELTNNFLETNTGVDPDAVAAIRRQRLREISLWFNPQNISTTVSQVAPDQTSDIPMENVATADNQTTKWAVEGTAMLVAAGLLTVILAWLIAPHVSKKTAKQGLDILIGGLCALTVVVVLRFFVLSRIKYGPAHYWAILFTFWFLVFGVWASRTRGARTS